MPQLVYPCVFLLSFLFTVLLTRPLITLLKQRHMGQSILEIGPAWHKPKEGTPTMGGSIFLVTIPLFSVVGDYLLDKKLSSTLIFVFLFALANEHVRHRQG